MFEKKKKNRVSTKTHDIHKNYHFERKVGQVLSNFYQQQQRT